MSKCSTNSVHSDDFWLIGTEIGIAILVFLLVLIGVALLATYLYKKKRQGKQGEHSNLRKSKRGASAPDGAGIIPFLY